MDHHDRDAGSSASVEQDIPIHEEENAPIDPIRQLQDVVIHMAENQARFFERQSGPPIQRPQVEANATLFKSFKAMDPPHFSGTKGEDEAESWLKKLKKIFTILEVADHDKLRLATFMLSEEAQNWWESTERVLTAAPDHADTVITWAQFEEVFNEKYFSQFYQGEKRREFMLLEQGSLSVE